MNPYIIGDAGQDAYTISFNSKDMVVEVLYWSLWNILGNLFNIKIWDDKLSIQEIDFNHVGFLVQFHNLPLEFMEEGNLREIGTRLGYAIATDIPIHNDCIMRSFPKVRINIDISNPFMIGLWVPTSTSKIKVHFCYEQLQNIFFGCGLLGHVQSCSQPE